ncbi:MAG: hypothetical protein C0501_16120 [Isosphaera sp.]|nr:hypothetical protein [Isosphaera sp.]
MKDVDIIAEIRAYRDAHAARFNYDIAAMVRDVQSRERLSGRVVIPPPPPPELDPKVPPAPAAPDRAKAG